MFQLTRLEESLCHRRCFGKAQSICLCKNEAFLTRRLLLGLYLETYLGSCCLLLYLQVAELFCKFLVHVFAIFFSSSLTTWLRVLRIFIKFCLLFPNTFPKLLNFIHWCFIHSDIATLEVAVYRFRVTI